jgi:hypothetical protein
MEGELDVRNSNHNPTCGAYTQLFCQVAIARTEVVFTTPAAAHQAGSVGRPVLGAGRACQ